LLRIGLLLPRDDYRQIVRPAVDWAYEQDTYGRQGNWALQGALVSAAESAREDAHAVLTEELLAFLAEKNLLEKPNWYLQVLRNFLTSLMANPACDDRVAELGTVMRDVNRIQRPRGQNEKTERAQ
jgi:hypothetical protein